MFEDAYGSADTCPENADGPHEPDATGSAYLDGDADADMLWVNIACKHCGRYGTIAEIVIGDDPIDWE